MLVVCFVWFCSLSCLAGTPVSEMMLIGPVALSVLPLSVLLATVVGSLFGVFLLFAVPRCLVGGCWMVIRCNFSRPEPWTGLCCSEQHWCPRRALCRTIWGALVQQRLTFFGMDAISTQWESEMLLLETVPNLFVLLYYTALQVHQRR